MINTWEALLAALVVLLGPSGTMFAILRYRRDDAGQIVAQQTAVLRDMRDLNDELQEALTRSRKERAAMLIRETELEASVVRLTGEVRSLRQEVRRLTEELEAKQ